MPRTQCIRSAAVESFVLRYIFTLESLIRQIPPLLQCPLPYIKLMLCALKPAYGAQLRLSLTVTSGTEAKYLLLEHPPSRHPNFYSSGISHLKQVSCRFGGSLDLNTIHMECALCPCALYPLPSTAIFALGPTVGALCPIIMTEFL